MKRRVAESLFLVGKKGEYGPIDVADYFPSCSANNVARFIHPSRRGREKQNNNKHHFAITVVATAHCGSFPLVFILRFYMLEGAMRKL